MTIVEVDPSPKSRPAVLLDHFSIVEELRRLAHPLPEVLPYQERVAEINHSSVHPNSRHNAPSFQGQARSWMRSPYDVAAITAVHAITM